uniref:Predicted protein n=1 Tax=Hordeum vulgare subsp. vulgare TaxID=112509 RepID=F2CSU7_HORVV|nr:predicted protein [Hordeum vulgare subsp. vulgare]BAJ96267.1 predicted protein [Hordeum vulgare subsp. vulgare]
MCPDSSPPCKNRSSSGSPNPIGSRTAAAWLSEAGNGVETADDEAKQIRVERGGAWQSLSSLPRACRITCLPRSPSSHLRECILQAHDLTPPTTPNLTRELCLICVRLPSNFPM